MCQLFTFGTGSWGNPVSVSGLLPREYAGFGKPDLISGLQGLAARMDVAWDATDLYGGGVPVILSRRADLPRVGNSFTVLKGTSKNDFSRAETIVPALTGDPAWSYSRVLTIMDSANTASLSVEIGLTRVLHGNGRVDTVRLAAAPPDSLLLDPEGLLNAGCSVPIVIESDRDTLAVAAAVYGNDAGKLLDGGRAGFEVARSGCDTAMARFGQQSVASLAFGTRTLILYSVPVSSLPIAFMLEQNYPNPFNPSTTIRYGVPDRMHVRLSVYNTLGQQVALLVNEIQESGTHDVRFAGGNIASGSYFYRIQAGPYSETKKLLLLKYPPPRHCEERSSRRSNLVHPADQIASLRSQ